MNVTVNCAGPHSADVPLYTASYPDDQPDPRPPAVLCADCADVYRVAVDAPAEIDGTGPDGKPAKVPNPEHMPPGQAPGADLVNQLLPGRRPHGWTPKHGYQPPGWAKAGDKPWPWPGPGTAS